MQQQAASESVTLYLPGGIRMCMVRIFLAGRGMRLPVNMQFPHHVTEDPAFGHGAVIEIQHIGASLEMGFRNGGFGCHDIEEKTQCRFSVFTVNASIFLVGKATAIRPHVLQVIVHDAEYRQRRYAFGEINPFRSLNMFEIGRRYIELPAVIAVFRLKPDRRRFP